MKRKLGFLAVALAVAAFLLPIAFLAVSASSPQGYFDGGRCACGHRIYIHVVRDGYFSYSPGHGVPEHRDFTLRSAEGGWDVIRLPEPDTTGMFMHMAATGVVAKLQFRDGAIYESWSGTNNWQRHNRIYNPWPIWISKLLAR